MHAQDSFKPRAAIQVNQQASWARPEVDWRELIDHRSVVPADESLVKTHHEFQERGVGYMAVLDGESVLGLCASRQVGMRLGSQYGFALFGKAPIRSCMVPDPLVIRVDQPWSEVLQRVFSRTGERFTEDVILVDGEQRFQGLISVQTLVRLQTRLLMESIAHLEEKQAEIVRRNQQMTDDLLMAREMQMAMLPRELPEVPSGLSPARGAVRVLHHYAPLGLVSGDFFEVLAVSGTALGILIADVMGHGVQAALVTAMMRALIQDHSPLIADPGAFLTALNRSLCNILATCRQPMFVSAFAVVADIATGSLSFANAGHPYPILLSRNSGEATLLDGESEHNGGVLGVSREAAFQAGHRPLEKGDRLLLFTDGLFEIHGGDGEILGIPGLLALAARRIEQPTEDLVGDLVEAVRTFSPTGEFQDDVCLVAVEIGEETAGSASGG